MFGVWAARKGHVWQILALALMLGAAYCIIVCLHAVGEISPLTGLPEYTAQVQKLQALASLWVDWLLFYRFLRRSYLVSVASSSIHILADYLSQCWVQWASRSVSVLSAIC